MTHLNANTSTPLSRRMIETSDNSDPLKLAKLEFYTEVKGYITASIRQS